MNDLINELQKVKNELRTSMNLLRKHGNELAEREHDYQVIKAQTVLTMKDTGCTMTEIQLSIKGQPRVSDALFERDKAKVLYDTNMEHINACKLEMRIIENQIAREWHNAG